MFAGGAAKSRALAAEIEAAAARVGVPFLDAGQVVKVSPIDGIHYDAEANPGAGRGLCGGDQGAFPRLELFAHMLGCRTGLAHDWRLRERSAHDDPP